MNLADFEALSFDCYGTLIDWETGILAVLRPWADAHGSTLSDEELLVAFSVHEAQAEVAAPTDLYPRILARSLRSLGTDLGIPVTDAEADGFGRSVPDWPAFPDSSGALEEVRDGPSIPAAGDEVEVRVVAFVRRSTSARTPKPDRHPSYQPDLHARVENGLGEPYGFGLDAVAGQRYLIFLHRRAF